MKLTNRDFAAKGRGAAQSCGIFFFCGPDEAGASAAANDLVTWLPEPGERVEIPGSQLRSDPAKLGDEARTTSLFGDKRHIWIRANGEEAMEALRVLTETADFGQPTAAMTRWRVSALPSTALPVPGVGRHRWLVELIRARAGESADFELEACDAAGRLALPADLVHRPGAAEGWRRGASG